MTASLLVELFTEELPPKALNKLGQAFANAVTEQLKQLKHLSAGSQSTAFASPRRLAVLITEVHGQSPDQQVTEKLLPAAIGLDAQGQATAPLLKKLKALGFESVQVEQLQRVSDGKQEQLVYSYTAPGKALADTLGNAVTQALDKLPIPKVMSYQRPDGSTVKFVRPAHGLVALHGDAVVPMEVLGLRSGRTTQGHRFLSQGEVSIADADAYEHTLEKQGKVIASFAKRRARIVEQLNSKAAGDKIIAPEALVDEVTALVEWPVAYEGQFEEAFLEVPQECLILTMQANQKYFAITDQQGRMKNRFLLISNLQTDTPRDIIGGNERVLRARLADARFFFQQDRKRPLASRVDALVNVVYHNQLGTQRQRVDRLVNVSGLIARQLANAGVKEVGEAHARRASLLAKADLVTDMVGEFPELQGTMGMYYARNDGEAPDIAQAIEDHYKPRFAGDALPASLTGVCAALSDKLETLVGIYSIGLVPTGDRDPFALRRHALGVVRMLIEKQLPLNLAELLGAVREEFKGFEAVKNADEALLGFVFDRLRGYLKDQGYAATEIEAVLAEQPGRLDTLLQKLEAVRHFSTLPEAAALAAANKRIGNILKKNGGVALAQVSDALLSEPAEQALHQKMRAVEPVSLSSFEAGRYADALTCLAQIKPEVDAFFDSVMVMAEDPQIRDNRIALLSGLHRLMNRVADLSQLAA